MSKRIKLIWDFWGEDGLKTAEHHAIHLREFSSKQNIQQAEIGVESNENEQSMAYMIVDEKDMITVRDTLRPKRGQWVR